MSNRLRTKAGSQTWGGIPCQILGMKIEYFKGLFGSALAMWKILAD